MYVLRIVRLVPAQPMQDQDEWPLQPPQTSVSGTQHWLVSRLVPPWPVTDDEVLPNATNFGLEDDVNASDLLKQIENPIRPVASVFEDSEILFFLSVDDDSLPHTAFFKQWLYTYPTFPFLDDDPWTLFTGINVDEDLFLVFPRYQYPTATAIVDDEVLANAVFIVVEEEFWSPQFTMTIANPIRAVVTLDTDAWVTFVPPPPSKAKGLPLVGVGS